MRVVSRRFHAKAERRKGAKDAKKFVLFFALFAPLREKLYLAVDVLDGPEAFFKYFSYHARYLSIRSRW